jgi:hypothetical protein
MTAPIACTLAPGEYADRLRSITDLNRSALRTVARDGPALVLTYASTAAPRLRALVAQEERCCAFLTFRIDELPDAVRLTVLAPVEAADAPDALFAPLLSGAETLSAANAGSSAGCAGACACAGAPERESGNTPRGCDPAPSTAAGRAARSVPSSQRIDRLPGAAATTAAVAALACGVCCVLPFALPAVMLTAA